MAYTLFGSMVPEFSDNLDGNPTTYGTRFWADIPGTVTSIRWYKGNTTTSITHVVGLYTDAGSLLRSKTTTSENLGWNTETLTSTVTITASTFYKAVVYYPHGHGVYSDHFFNTAYDNSPLHCNANSNGQGGQWIIATGISNPTNVYAGEGYYIDVEFNSASSPVTLTATGLASAASFGGLPLICPKGF